jgi:hypothetical protein
MSAVDYLPDWQKNRVDFAVNHLGKDFFKGKTLLELGPYNGAIGLKFQELGAKVTLCEGREANSERIRNTTNLEVITQNLDTEEWNLGKFDIIVNWGLFYHLEFHYEKHLINCLENCDVLFFETEVWNSLVDGVIVNKPPTDFKGDYGDQSISINEIKPSRIFIENIFNRYPEFISERFDSSLLNGNGHVYNWYESGDGNYIPQHRRYWICQKKKI